MRACVELAKDWRTDKYLRNLEAMMIVADKSVTLVLTGTGDVLEPERGIIAIGSGGNYALAAARALADSDLDAWGNLKVPTDYQQLYTNLLGSWMGTDPADVIPNAANFTPLDLVA